MAETLHELATKVLLLLAHMRRTTDERGDVDGPTLSKITNRSPADVNDAISLLQQSGYVGWNQHLGAAPYVFGSVWVTPVGRYEAERVSTMVDGPLELNAGIVSPRRSQPEIALPPAPIGSPYGFNEEDWEFIAGQKAQVNRLLVVMGYQFVSTYYDSKLLRQNVQAMFQKAVEQYTVLPASLGATLEFRALAAGYGEHLFNEVARDIIASDIAVFDTSDHNPNVMVELGVALTWGVRVLPIKHVSRPRPPSDISGQTWADYEEHGSVFADREHCEKLLRMVDRAMRKKGPR